MRVQLDEYAAARVRKERDELLQKDAEASQRAIDLLAELEMEWDLKLRAEERSAALQHRANLDAGEIARLRRGGSVRARLGPRGARPGHPRAR